VIVVVIIIALVERDEAQVPDAVRPRRLLGPQRHGEIDAPKSLDRVRVQLVARACRRAAITVTMTIAIIRFRGMLFANQFPRSAERKTKVRVTMEKPVF
jgi:hypothetical protein